MNVRNVLFAAAAAFCFAAGCAKNTSADTTAQKTQTQPNTNTSQGGISGAGSSASQTGSTMGGGNSSEYTGARTGTATPSDVGTLSGEKTEDFKGTAGSTDSMRSDSATPPASNGEKDSQLGTGGSGSRDGGSASLESPPARGRWRATRSTTHQNPEMMEATTSESAEAPSFEDDTGTGGSGPRDGGTSVFEDKDVTGGSGSDDRSGGW